MARTSTPNRCPSCDEPHAFSLIEEAEIDAYVTDRNFDLMPRPPITDERFYRVYVCPAWDGGFVVASEDGDLLNTPEAE